MPLRAAAKRGYDPTMMPLDPHHLADALLPSVLAAGRLQMRYLGSDIAVRQKDDLSPVTAADHESEAMLLGGLNQAAPGVPVLAEERSAAGITPTIGATFFAVDPLDGTKEFIAGRHEFTINIGLVHEGRPVFGLIYAPALDAMYVTRGEGEAAYCKLRADADVASFAQCALEPIRARTPPAGAMLGLTSRSRSNARTTAFLSSKGVVATQATGSSLKFCLIAHGLADVYARHGPTCEWDTAAGQAILEAAGGSVVMLDGQALAYGKSADRFVNPEFVAWGHVPLVVASP